MTDKLPEPRKMIRRKALREFLPLGLTQIRQHERDDPDFPKRVPLSAGGKAVAYYADEVAAYQQKLSHRREKRLKAAAS